MRRDHGRGASDELGVALDELGAVVQPGHQRGPHEGEEPDGDGDGDEHLHDDHRSGQLGHQPGEGTDRQHAQHQVEAEQLGDPEHPGQPGPVDPGVVGKLHGPSVVQTSTADRARRAVQRSSCRSRRRGIAKVSESDSAVRTSSSGPAATARPWRRSRAWREAGRDLLDVVAHQHRGRGVLVERERGQRADEVLAPAEVEAGRGLVEEQQLRVGHEGASDLDALALALAEGAERAVEQVADADLREQLGGPVVVQVVVVLAPAADDARTRPTRRRRARARCAGCGRPAPPLVSPIRGRSSKTSTVPSTSPEDADDAAARVDLRGAELQQRRLAGTVRPQHHPALVLLDGPVDPRRAGWSAPGSPQTSASSRTAVMATNLRHRTRPAAPPVRSTRASTDLPDAAAWALWFTAWAGGRAGPEEAMDGLQGSRGPDAPHRVAGLPGEAEPVPLLVAWGRLRRAGAHGAGLALPRPGDPLGLAGPPTFNAEALDAGRGCRPRRRRPRGRAGARRARRGVARAPGQLAPSAARPARGRSGAADRPGHGGRSPRRARRRTVAARGGRRAVEPAPHLGAPGAARLPRPRPAGPRPGAAQPRRGRPGARRRGCGRLGRRGRGAPPGAAPPWRTRRAGCWWRPARCPSRRGRRPTTAARRGASLVADMTEAGTNTLLITLTGKDRPGVTSTVFDVVGGFGVEVLDIEQIVLRRRLVLGVLVTAPRDWTRLRSAVERGRRRARHAGRGRAGHRGQPARAEGRSHVTVLGAPLRSAAVAAITGRIADTGANIDRIERMARYPVTAIDLHVSGADPDRLRAVARRGGRPPAGRRRRPARRAARRGMRLVVMDVDSTLIQGEVIEMLADHAGCREEVQRVTEQAMRRRAGLRGVAARAGRAAGGRARRRALDEVYDAITLAPGARTMVRTLKRLGYRFAIVSGGFTQVTDRIAADLGIDFSAANELEIVDGRLTGRIVGDVVDRAGKADGAAPVRRRGAASDGLDGGHRGRRQRPRHALRGRPGDRVQRQAGGAARRPTRRSTCPTSTRSCTCSASAARRSRRPTLEAGFTTPSPPLG